MIFCIILWLKSTQKVVFSVKKLISTSKRHEEHPFAGRNTQHAGSLRFELYTILFVYICGWRPWFLWLYKPMIPNLLYLIWWLGWVLISKKTSNLYLVNTWFQGLAYIDRVPYFYQYLKTYFSYLHANMFLMSGNLTGLCLYIPFMTWNSQKI